MTDHFSMRLDMDTMIRSATKRIADQAESALREAVVDELRHQGWTVLPPHAPHTPTDDEREAQAEVIVSRHLSRLAKQGPRWAEDDTAIGGQAANIVRQLAEAELLRPSEVTESSETERIARSIAESSAWDYRRALAFVEAVEAMSPEPQGEPSEVEFPFTHDGVTLEQDDGGVWISMLHERARWIGPKALAAIKASRMLAEPQGEPSDARHVAHVTVEWAYESDCLEGECVHRDEDGEPEDMSVCPNVPPFEVCVGCMEDEGRGSDPEQWDDVPLMPWPCPAALRAAGGAR